MYNVCILYNGFVLLNSDLKICTTVIPLYQEHKSKLRTYQTEQTFQ